MAKAATARTEHLPTKTESKANLPATAADEFAGMPTGLENVTAKDLVIPRITILQALSPQLIKSKPEFIKGAAAGMFCDVATGDTWADSLDFLPCFYATIYLEWAPRSSGKGLVANHGTNAAIMSDCTFDDKRRAVLPSGNYIAETATYYGLNMSAGGRRSFIPLSSTQLKASRKWMTLITNQRLKRSDGSEFVPPLFYRCWRAEITEQSNSEGSWFGWKFSPGNTVLELDPTKALLADARDFYEQARAGLVQGDLSSYAEEGAADRSSSDDSAM
jgi:hypothetical protein